MNLLKMSHIQLVLLSLVEFGSIKMGGYGERLCSRHLSFLSPSLRSDIFMSCKLDFFVIFFVSFILIFEWNIFKKFNGILSI
jgi:hypothetical protein